MSDNNASAAKAELAQSVREKMTNQLGFAEHTGTTPTLDEYADAALRAVEEHLQDPRTVERACETYFSVTGTDWRTLHSGTQDMWRSNVQKMLASVLE